MRVLLFCDLPTDHSHLASALSMDSSETMRNCMATRVNTDRAGTKPLVFLRV